MRSKRIELARTGNPRGVAEMGREYVISVDSDYHGTLEMPLGHEQLLDLLSLLRYNPQVTDEQRAQALAELSRLVTPVLKNVVADEDEDFQLDLITSARELWVLPLEAALGDDGTPRFVRTERAEVLTRRVPKGFAERAPYWPARPHVLFVHASPAWASASRVEADAHLQILREILRPFMPPRQDMDIALEDEGPVITVLADATLAQIEEACRRAEEEKKPYTHVHLLAHGVTIKDPVFRHKERYGIALNSDDDQPTPAEDLAKALRPSGAPEAQRAELPVVVSLASCDSGNAVNTIITPGGLAQELHGAGVPVVIASQLPLTFAGAEIMLREFYAAWIAGHDVRRALHTTRMALYRARDIKPVEKSAGHDWVSLVAYVRLPEGYADYLMDVRLQTQLAALENASKLAEHMVVHGSKNAWEFDKASASVRRCIERLDSMPKDISEADRHRLRHVLQENAGMLASAHKRFAELLYQRAADIEEGSAEARTEGLESLKKAHEKYLAAFRSNASHHWSGVQYLALEAVLTGSIPHPRWYTCQVAAEHDRDFATRASDRVWALGSLAELALLAPVAGIGPDEAGDAGAVLAQLCTSQHACPPDTWGVLTPTESTRRQLMRYVTWWTAENGFFGSRDADLSAEAQRLVALLDAELARRR